MSTCKVVRIENGRLVPVLPTGEVIPGIERGSIKYFQDEEFRRGGLAKVQVTLLVKEGDIEGGYPLTEENVIESNLAYVPDFTGFMQVAESLKASVYDVLESYKKEIHAESLSCESKMFFLKLVNDRRIAGKPLDLDALAFELLNNAIEYAKFKPTEEQPTFIPVHSFS
jgi:hypothetical protein